jgi:hypothetical protein
MEYYGNCYCGILRKITVRNFCPPPQNNNHPMVSNRAALDWKPVAGHMVAVALILLTIHCKAKTRAVLNHRGGKGGMRWLEIHHLNKQNISTNKQKFQQTFEQTSKHFNKTPTIITRGMLDAILVPSPPPPCRLQDKCVINRGRQNRRNASSKRGGVNDKAWFLMQNVSLW